LYNLPPAVTSKAVAAWTSFNLIRRDTRPLTLLRSKSSVGSEYSNLTPPSLAERASTLSCRSLIKVSSSRLACTNSVSNGAIHHTTPHHITYPITYLDQLFFLRIIASERLELRQECRSFLLRCLEFLPQPSALVSCVIERLCLAHNLLFKMLNLQLGAFNCDECSVMNEYTVFSR